VYTVLLVDDEPLVRLALKTLIPWEEHGFARPLEAGNGEQALHLLQNRPEIDLVFLDISMPVMTGLELLERLQVSDRKPEVIVLSAYDDYPLVREAFKKGVADYLLKAELGPERVLQLLRASRERIESARRASSSPQELVRQEARYLKEDILQRLLRPEGVERFQDHKEILGIRLGTRVRVGVLWIEDFATVARRYADAPGSMAVLKATVLNTIGQVLAKRLWGEALSRSDEEYVLFLSFAAEAREDEKREQAETGETVEILEEIRKALRHYANLEISTGCSTVSDLSTSLQGLYEEARSDRRLPSRLAVKARKYIHEHYSRPSLSLAEISTYLGVSPSHFCYQFARETGQTFKEYLTKVRVEEARRLLLDTCLKVYEISERVGYLNPEHFSRVYKHHTGLSPHTWGPARESR
jgi:two-component system response regulator YesN